MSSEIFDDIGRAVSEAAETVGRKTGQLVELARLKNQIYNLEREIKKDYSDLGKMIYESYIRNRESLDDSLLPICEEITQKEVLMDQYKGEIDSLKND